ncbi:hypothetical protein U0070_007744, partial [Myodes glareolus]
GAKQKTKGKQTKDDVETPAHARGWLAGSPSPAQLGTLKAGGRRGRPGGTRRHFRCGRARYFPAGLASSRHSRDRAAGQAFPVGVSSSSLLDTSHEGEELAGASQGGKPLRPSRLC